MLKEYLENFINYLLNIRGYSKLTVETYKISLYQMAEVSHFYEEDSIWILDITPFRIKIAKNSKKTIVKKLSSVRSFVKYLDEQCIFDVKLIADDTIKVPQNLPKPIEEIYIVEILNSATINDKLIVTMLYGLGLRISELSNIKLKDIKNNWITIYGKGSKARELPLLEKLNILIDEYITIYNPKRFLFEKDEKPMGTAQLRYRLSKLFKGAGIKATPHQLRHSFATHLLNNGARISDVSELLGHETMATTQIYTKLGSVKKMAEYMKAHPLANR